MAVIFTATACIDTPEEAGRDFSIIVRTQKSVRELIERRKAWETPAEAVVRLLRERSREGEYLRSLIR